MIGSPSTTTAWYVYGVVSAAADAPAGTRLVEHGPLAAVAAEVPLAEFGEEVLRERLNDRTWLEEHVRRHEEVLDPFVGRVPVVPLRFGAIYGDVEDVRGMLAAREEVFLAALRRLQGLVEVGVKAWFEAARIERPAAATGRAYLERRRGELSSAREAASFAQAAHGRLLAVAVDGVANRPQPRELTGRAEPMLLNGAYLVRAEDDVLVGEVERLDAEGAALGVSFETTGPWPPYNFVGAEEAAR